MNGLKYIRTRCNISLSELAEIIGVTRQALNSWENGKKDIPEQRREQFASFFGVEKEYFGEIFVLRKIERYRKVWDKYSTWILLISLSLIAVLGDVVRKYIPINLMLLLGIINIAAMEIKIYYRDNKELY